MDEEDNSLDGGATYAGLQDDSLSDMSLGDEGTLSDKLGDQETVIDDSEVVDLESRYKVESTLGRGGMGEVILAVDTRLGRKVAIKRILGEAARSKTAVDRFLTEAKSIAAIGDHPNIVQIYDYGRAKDGPFIIIEYVDGINLQDRCRDGALPLEEAVDLTCQLCDGLSRAHDQGIVHRDIKPANVLLTKNGVPKLTDFGLAKADATDHQMTVAGAVLGTPDFMPPEQRRDAAEVDARSDLWSLAATLYQMVTGRSPKIIRFRDVPDELEDILGKALEESKDDRFQTIKEFRDALKSSLATDSASSKPIQVAGTLAEGQCKACGTVTGDLNRKFCRNPECGASLRVACLKCEVQIPVWDGICGECGANQPQLIQARRESLEELRAEAEQFLNELSFDEAISATEQIVQESHPDLADLWKWGEDFLLKVEREKEQQLAAVERHVKEANVHIAAFDYEAAIHALESIADPLKNNDVLQLLSFARNRHEESTSLLSLIRASIKSKELGGLIPKVRRVQELCGDREDLKKLLAQLIERRDTKLLRVRKAFENDELRRAAARADGLDMTDFNSDDQAFIKKVKQVGELESSLCELVQEVKEDAVVTKEEAQSVLDLVLKALEIVPSNLKMLKLKDQCLRQGAVDPKSQWSGMAKCEHCGKKTFYAATGVIHAPIQCLHCKQIFTPSSLVEADVSEGNTAVKEATRTELPDLLALKLHNFTNGNVFKEPNIPQNKLNNALKKYGSGIAWKDVVLLYDNTVFGGAADGFFLTQTQICWHNIFENACRKRLSNIGSVSAKGSNIVLNGTEVINVNCSSSCSSAELAKTLAGVIDHFIKYAKKTV